MHERTLQRILTHFIFAINVRNNGPRNYYPMLSEDALMTFSEDGMTVNSP